MFIPPGSDVQQPLGQSVEQLVTLPAGFKAERVTIEIRPAQRTSSPFRQTFVWNPDAT